ncbi:PKD domain-containing protein [Cecembia rubra]|uniref:PKD domain-containing protein n=1 Tax=Cecembia rubra TaxID=1485585 RepID=UPI0027155E31|nr:PKD domain-containing protein [Cecembia rubra]
MEIRKSLIFSFLALVFSLTIFRLTAIVGTSGYIFPKIAEEDPVADFTFDPEVLCADQAIKFTNTSTGDSLSYEWNFGDGKTSTLKDPSHIFSTVAGGGTQTFNVKLTIKDKRDSVRSITKSVTVNQVPSMAVGSDKGSVDFENLSYFILCENSSSVFTFYNNSTTRSTNVLYEIDWGDGSTPFSGSDWTELSHEYDRGIYDITYTITSANGCKFTKKYGVFVGGNPAVGLGNPGNTNVCVGSQLTFPITGTENNPEGTRYFVFFSDDFNNPQIFEHPAPPTVTHTFGSGSCSFFADGFNNSFSVRIIAVNPCSSSAATVVPIYVSENPNPLIDLPKDPVCKDVAVQIRNRKEEGKEVATNGQCSDPRFVWEISPATGWVLDGGSLGTINNPSSPNSWVSGTEFIFPRFTEAGTYTIKLTTGNRCGIKFKEETICVIPEPVPDFQLDNILVCAPDIVEATNTSNVLGACDLDFFQWSVAYNGGNCGPGADWKFAEGNAQSPNAKFEFINPGRYTITLTASTSCGTFSKSQEVVVSTPPIVEINNIQDLCVNGSISPSANVRACDDGQISYKWTFEGGIPSSSEEEVPGQILFDSPGEKIITLEVSSSCGTTIKTQSINVNPLPQVDAGADIEICEGESLTLNGTVLPVGNYNFQWTADPVSNIIGANTLTPTISPRVNTTYTLRARNTVTGCEEFDQITVTVIPAPVVVFDIPNQVICSGESTLPVNIFSDPTGEQIKWTVNGNGIAGLNISEGENIIPSFTLVNTSNSAIELVFTAQIVKEDAGNCTLTPGTYVITVKPEPSFKDETLEICSEQDFSYIPEGFVPGTTFLWTSAAPNGIIGNTNNTTVRQAAVTDKLINETNVPLELLYTITPFLGGCSGDPFQLSVTVLPSPVVDFSIPDQIICTGGFTEEVIISSDVETAQFTWTAIANGALGVIPSGVGNLIPVQQIINPSQNPIIVRFEVFGSVSGENSCAGLPKIYRITVNPTISLVSEVSDYSGFQISCTGANDGFIRLNPRGGSGNYTFTWTGSNGFKSNQKDINNLPPGNYSVLIEDEFGCSLEKDFTLVEPSPLAAELASTRDIFCSGESTGQIFIKVSGGVSAFPYQFNWFRNGQPFNATGQNLIDVPSGIYEVEIADRNGCVIALGPIELIQPELPLVIGFEKTDISCYDANDGFIKLDIQGGVPPFRIAWNNNSTRDELNNLGPGNYTVQVSDQAGCVKTQTIIIEDAPLFRILPEVRQISCFGKKDGYIKLNFEGGVGKPIVLWNNGEDRNELFNLGPGTYSVLIKDETDCEIRSTFNIVEPAELLIEPQIFDAIDCINPQSGSINLGISGGRPPYTYVWSNGQTSSNLTNIPAGQYNVVVRDASGCEIKGTFEVKRPAPLAITSVRRTFIACDPRLIEEEIQVSISGGVAPYRINWSGGKVSQNGQVMNTTKAGLYTVQITDGAGCTTTQSYEVKNLDVLPDLAIQSLAFDQYKSYLVNFEIQFWNRSFGEIAGYYWDFGDGNFSTEENPKHSYLKEGEYEVILKVTDIYGCVSEVKSRIKVFDYFLVMPNAFTPNGDGVNDYFFPRFINIASLEFWVLNKWGETIFYTDDKDSKGWDGTVGGKEVPAGNYLYKLSFKTLDGRKQDKTEVFLLLK